MAGEEEEGRILDLTSAQLHNLNEVNLPSTLIELDLTANRLSTLDDRISQLVHLQKISLRQNLLGDEAAVKLGGWSALSGLQELILRDNKLTKVPPTSAFPRLEVFDVSFNELTSLEGVEQVAPTLRELYVSKNEVAKIQGLQHLKQLRLLELGSNKIRVVEGLEDLTLLQELWLGRNRIKSVNLCGLTSIVKMSLQSNRLTCMLGFQGCVALEELYLSHNAISKMEGLASLSNLRVLDVSSNKLSAIADVDGLNKLEDLWLNDNQIPVLDGIEKLLSGSRETLTTIYLERNPCAFDAAYHHKLTAAFPNLQQIDSRVL